MALAFDGIADNGAAGGNPSTVTLSTTQTFDVVFVVSTTTGGPAVSSVSDTAGLTWHSLISINDGYNYQDVWYAIANDALTNDVISVSYPAGNSGQTVQAFAISGADVTSPFAATPGTSTVHGVGASVSTSSEPTFIIGALNNLTQEYPNPGPGWSAENEVYYSSIFYAAVSSTGVFTPSQASVIPDLSGSTAIGISPNGGTAPTVDFVDDTGGPASPNNTQIISARASAAGELVVLFSDGSYPITGITDTEGSTWTRQVQTEYSSGLYLECWYTFTAVPWSDNTMTVTFSGTTPWAACVVSFANVDSGTPFNGSFYSGGDAPAVFTPTIANTMVIGFLSFSNPESPSPVGSWTQIDSNYYNLVCYQIADTANVNYTPDTQEDNSDLRISSAIALAPAGAFYAYVSESLTTTDAVNYSEVSHIAVAESLTPVDTLEYTHSGTYAGRVGESLSPSDSIAIVPVLPVALIESQFGQDSVSVSAHGTMAVHETAAAVDSIYAYNANVIPVAVSEVLAPADTVGVALSGLVVSVSETLSPVDAFTFSIEPIFVNPGLGTLAFTGFPPNIIAYPYLKTSDSFAFVPSLGEMVLYCYERVGVRRPEITASHLMDARVAANMILSDWANDQVDLWAVDEQTVDLVAGRGTYPVATDTVLILDAYVRTNANLPDPVDLIIYPISRTEWASMPDKHLPGRPVAFWFDRLMSPNITLYNPPLQGTPTFQLRYWRVRQMQNAELARGKDMEIPYRFLNAFADALCVELAEIYNPVKIPVFTKQAGVSWDKARTRDVEEVPFFITPGTSGYFRTKR